ncbi:Ras association domain-containing protein 10 [Larimichthys crocea]|uniref:Ras association domain-containing protein 10 n=1 Tax=Larimichthys crocea TaxID=215358 RepID=A0A6G0IX37_LARCR|nr:ras association domain-containing protein 10 [Larimichthys crocea]KAE8295853.1 Ras association domain-containing protein 10 [Larimichthys crocea]
MEPEEGKISVWVCREEKLVSGLTKRTTCADVVKVLLEDQNLQQGASAAMLSGSPQSYCVVEKWRGFERILPNKTKILRLWSAWGDEQENVRFVLVKNEASLPNNGPRSAEARVVQSRGESGGPGGVLKGTARTCWTAAAAAANLSQEKQRRIVRKAFRKLDKMNKKKEQTVCKDKGSVEKMETLVHLVISQDHTIRQQIQRIKELDREIERYEAKVHFDRIKRHGVNYVQDTYMVDSSETPLSSSKDCKRKAERQDGAADALAQFEEYARRCEEVVRLQEELTEREALVESITGEIQEELNRRWMKRRREERGAEAAKDAEGAAEEMCLASAAPGVVAPDVESLSENELVLEEERIKTQLDTSLYIGLRLKTDLDAIRGDLDLSLALWETKESELLDLLAKVETMELEQVNSKLTVTGDGKGELAAAAAVVVSAEVEPGSAEKSGGGGGWVEQARGLSKTCNTNDEDSDTGLSSMHSQDSDNPPVCESLV